MTSKGRQLLESDREVLGSGVGVAASLSEAISRPKPKQATLPEEKTERPVEPVILKKVIDPVRVVLSGEGVMAAVSCEKVVPLQSPGSGEDYIGFMLYKPENGDAVEPLLNPPKLFNLMIEDKYIPGRFVILPIYNRKVCYLVVEYDFAQGS